MTSKTSGILALQGPFHNSWSVQVIEKEDVLYVGGVDQLLEHSGYYLGHFLIMKIILLFYTKRKYIIYNKIVNFMYK